MLLLAGCSSSLHLKTEEINTMPLKMYIFVEKYKDNTFTLKISNQSGYEMEYSDAFYLQQWEDTKWVTVEEKKAENTGVLQDLEEVELTWRIDTQLDKGKYQIVNNQEVVQFELE